MDETATIQNPKHRTDEGAGALSSEALLGAALRVLLWGYVAFTLAKHGLIEAHDHPGVDYIKHWLAPVAVLYGKNNYIDAWYNPDGIWLWLGFNYPQWSAIVTFWLGWFDIVTAEVIWKLMLLGMIVASWWIVFRIFRPEAAPQTLEHLQSGTVRAVVSRAIVRHWGLTSAVIVAAFSPASVSSIYIGNIDPWNAFLATAFVGALLIGRERLAGIYWAMFCLIKMMPVLLVFPILFFRRWRLMQGFLLFMLGYLIVLLATGRVGYEWFFVHEMMPEISYYWRIISISIPRAALLIFAPELADDPALYGWATRIGLGLIGLLYLAAVFWMRRRGRSFLRTLEVSLLFLPLLSPLLEGHHLAWVMPVIFLQLRRWASGAMPGVFMIGYMLGWFITFQDYNATNLMQHLGYWAKFMVLPGLLVVLTTAILEQKFAPGEEQECAGSSE